MIGDILLGCARVSRAGALIALIVLVAPARQPAGAVSVGQEAHQEVVAARTLVEGQATPVQSCRELSSEGVDLRCIDLEPTSAFQGVSARIDMHQSATPFGVAVSADGTPRYDLTAQVSGLQRPAGDDRAYVAWLTTEFMAPVARLGTLSNGENDLGTVALNKFRVLVSLEPDSFATVRSGELVVRGASPSSRLQGHDFAFASPLAAYGSSRDGERGDPIHGHQGHDMTTMPPRRFDLSMPPGMMHIRPDVQAWLPASTENIPRAKPQSWMRMADGDTLRLTATPVRRRLQSRDVIMYGFNGELPGPLIEVRESATIVVDFLNQLPLPMAVHWHGIRLENQYDGVPGVTQDPVAPGERFEYKVHFRDPGLYWYHPHHREDIFQDLGLYGNMLVRPPDADTDAFDREEVLLLDDILMDDKIVAYGEEAANYALMGRFGNVLLVNGEPEYNLSVEANEIVRLYLTNVSNTRTFNLRFKGAEVAVVGSDLGMFEWQTPVSSIVIAPAERYIVDLRYRDAGRYALTNAVQALDHINATYFPAIDTLGSIDVRVAPSESPRRTARRNLTEAHANDASRADMRAIRSHWDRPVDHTLELTLRVDGLPAVVEQLMRSDRVYFSPVEWEGTMPMMNWASTTKEVAWVLRDTDTGLEDMDIDWTFRVGDVVKLRLINDRDTFHGMQHPLHIHGQRFAVISRNGQPNENLVWKDTVLLPAGSTTEILLELSNPGRWMVHCHIAEHLEAGMKMVFTVEP